MKIVVFGPRRRVGALVGETVVDLHLAVAAHLARTGDETAPYAMATALCPPDLQHFIEGGRRALDAAGEALGEAAERPDAPGALGETVVHPLSDVRVHAPLPSPGVRILNAGGNYRDHVTKALRNSASNPSISDEELLAGFRSRGNMHFLKSTRTVVASGTPVMFPDRTRLFDYEGEVVVVLGRAGRDIPAEDIASYVWGYTLQNDLSIREMPNMMNFGHYKNFDGSCPLGPCIVVDEITDPQDVDFETRVDGQLRQQGNTRDMVFSFGELLAYLSQDQTLLPGDMISAGTCAGTAMDSSPLGDDGKPVPGRFLRPGQAVEVSSTAIGVLRTPIIEKR